MSYKFYNANACGKFHNDCTVRAISLAEGKTWDETYEELSDIAQRNGIILDDVNFIEPLLDSRYKRICPKQKKCGSICRRTPKRSVSYNYERTYHLLHRWNDI